MLLNPSCAEQSAEGVARLCELYSILPGLPKKGVDLGHWRAVGNDVHKAATDTALMHQSCGTKACAVGWAAAYPPFIAQGFIFHASSYGNGPRFAGRSSWDAVKRFFDLKLVTARYLFSDQAEKYPITGPVDLRPGMIERRKDIENGGLVSEKMDPRVQVMRRILAHLYIQNMISWDRYNECLGLIKTEVLAFDAQKKVAA